MKLPLNVRKVSALLIIYICICILVYLTDRSLCWEADIRSPDLTEESHDRDGTEHPSHSRLAPFKAITCLASRDLLPPLQFCDYARMGDGDRILPQDSPSGTTRARSSRYRVWSSRQKVHSDRTRCSGTNDAQADRKLWKLTFWEKFKSLT